MGNSVAKHYSKPSRRRSGGGNTISISEASRDSTPAPAATALASSSASSSGLQPVQDATQGVAIPNASSSGSIQGRRRRGSRRSRERREEGESYPGGIPSSSLNLAAGDGILVVVSQRSPAAAAYSPYPASVPSGDPHGGAANVDAARSQSQTHASNSNSLGSNSRGGRSRRRRHEAANTDPLTSRRDGMDASHSPAGYPLYLPADGVQMDMRKLRKMVKSGQLAPAVPGLESPSKLADSPMAMLSEMDECPICMLFFPALNWSTCCGKGICTECYAQVLSKCPFCMTHDYSVRCRVRSSTERRLEIDEQERLRAAELEASKGVSFSLQDALPAPPPPSTMVSARRARVQSRGSTAIATPNSAVNVLDDPTDLDSQVWSAFSRWERLLRRQVADPHRDSAATSFSASRDELNVLTALSDDEDEDGALFLEQFLIEEAIRRSLRDAQRCAATNGRSRTNLQLNQTSVAC